MQMPRSCEMLVSEGRQVLCSCCEVLEFSELHVFVCAQTTLAGEVHHDWNVLLSFQRKWELTARQASCDECWRKTAHNRKEMVKNEIMCNTFKLTKMSKSDNSGWLRH